MYKNERLDENFLKLVQLYKSVIPVYKPELFKKLLDKNFDVNYMIPDNCTITGKDRFAGRTIFQLVGNEPNACQILIDRGVDCTVTDEEGSTVLLQETTNLRRKITSSIIFVSENSDQTFYESETLEFPHHAAILSAHVNSENPKNPRNKYGLSHFHIACMHNQVDVVKFFLENGVPVDETVNSNSKYCPGYSALHFAVKFGALETVELLLTSGADSFAKDSKGMNPLHVLLDDRKKILTMQRLSRHSTSGTEKKGLKLFNQCNINLKMINLLLDTMKKCGRYLCDDIELSHFHVLCFLGNTFSVLEALNNIGENLSQAVNLESPIWSGYTPLHFAAHYSVEMVELLVSKGADLRAKDANGETPFDICLREFPLLEVHRILSLCPDNMNIVFSDGKTKLNDFIQAMQETATFENFLKNNCTNPNMFIPFDSPVCAGYSPLHLTVICSEQQLNWTAVIQYSTHITSDLSSKKSQSYLSRIDSCLRLNPDVSTRDARGTTPLHWAFSLQKSVVVHRLLKRHESSFNPVNEYGLSHLHIACAARNEDVVQKLLSGGADVNGIVTSSYFWFDDLKSTVQAEICAIGNRSTPLHLAAAVYCPEIIKTLIEHRADVLIQNADGFNPLETIIRESIFKDSECPKPQHVLTTRKEKAREAIILLIRKIEKRLGESKPKQMLYCYSFLEDSLLDGILSHGDESATKILETVGVTALHVACFNRNLEKLNEFIDLIDVNTRVSLESPLWPGCTPLHFILKSAGRLSDSPVNMEIITRLLERGADVAATNAESETPILRSLQFNIETAATLLKHLKDFSVNPMDKAGFTHLHVASICGDPVFVEKLLDHGALIDQPTDYFVSDHGGFTALHFSACLQRQKVVEVLLKRGADANWRNAFGENSLHAATRKYPPTPCLELLRALIKAGADIYARNMFGRTPLETLIKSENPSKEEIEIFVAHGSHVNTFNPISDEGLLAVALNKSRQLPIFEMVVKAPDVRDIDDNGRNAIHNAVSFKRPDWKEIEEEDAIDEKYTPSDGYVKGIESLINLDLNIDHQDYEGSTPLHVAAKMQNLTGIVGLLANGADINIEDADGKPAFAYSLELAQLQKEHMKLDRLILTNISAHMCKLQLAGIRISKFNLEVEAILRRLAEFHALELETVEYDDEAKK